MQSRHAVVLVSGGAAVTPYTSPAAAAGRGQPAGNTMSALRAFLLDEGHAVYTAPARIGVGEVDEDAGWEGFDEVPAALPAVMTINSVGGIDEAGVALAAFLEHLVATHRVESFDLVGHSMGGLFARAALAVRHGRGADLGALDPDAALVPVRRLATLGTPWTGALLGDYVVGDLTLADAAGDPTTETILREAERFAAENSQGAAEQVAERYLSGPDGWNARQASVLDGIVVTLVAGTALRAADEPELLWPHDGLVAKRSALASLVPPEVLPMATRAEFDDVHSIFFADRLGLPWERALTWDPAVHELVHQALTTS